MIKLRKLAGTSEALTKLQERSQRLKALLEAGQDVPAALLESYRAPEVKALIRMESHDKCMYCESKIVHVYFGDIEHIFPKSVSRELTLEYRNLGYACAVCNGLKRDYHDADLPLVNPYIDDPDEEFFALGPLIKRRPDRDRAHVTEKRLELNRTQLIERRNERLESLCNLADVYAKSPSGPLRNLLAAQLREEAADDKEYAFIVRGYLEKVFSST